MIFQATSDMMCSGRTFIHFSMVSSLECNTSCFRSARVLAGGITGRLDLNETPL